LGEIETLLAEHPAVQEAVALAREDSPGDTRLVAYVMSQPEMAVEVSELRDFLQQKLPGYMVPSAFVFLDALPLTPNGKVDRRALPAPDVSRPEPEANFVAPRDALEYQLAKIWEKTLGIQPIGMQDSFFDLGGHSLMAMRLLAQMEKVSGKKLPLVTLFQAPTIEQQASLLRQTAWVAPWASLVAIQPAGSKPPFFCVHAVAGNILFYSDLARYLGPDQPLYGLQSRGLDGSDEPFTRVEEMAAHYLQEMQTIQPEGPYFLGGLSLGGTVIFEIAQQLRRQGQEVALLLMFDTYGPGYPHLSVLRAIQQMAARLGHRIHTNIVRFRQLQSHDKGAFALEKVRNITARSQRKNQNRLDRIREKIEWVMYKWHRSMGRPLPPALRYLYVRERNAKAEKAYVAKPYPGRITLFRATRQPLGCAPEPYLGWDKVASEGVEIYDLPGSHSQHLIREPKIQVVIDQLQACLSAAQATAAEKQS
jgi:aspartate racemase